MPMPNFISKWRRQRVCDAVVTNGERLRDLRAVRAGISADVWPQDAEAFDQMIESLERRQRRRIDYLKKTA